MATQALDLMHCSMQFSDSPAQKRKDVTDIFKRADQRKVVWITGTEAGENPLWKIIEETAKAHKFRLHRWRSNWIAVRASVIKSGTWEKGHVFVADKDETVGPGHDSGFPWVNFEFPGIGRVAIAAGHYPTKGQRPGDPNYKITVRYAERVGQWARTQGAGKRIAFYGGDQNIPDDKLDTFRGQPMTSLWDELRKHESTGHGNIDVIASYDRDGRVRGTYVRALSDKEFPQHSDHFVIEGGYAVKTIR